MGPHIPSSPKTGAGAQQSISMPEMLSMPMQRSSQLARMLMVKSQAGRALASAETVQGRPRWVSAPLMMAHGRCR